MPAEELNRAVDDLAAGRTPAVACAELKPLLHTARQLLLLPRPHLQAQLAAALEAQARALSAPRPHLVTAHAAAARPLPSLLGHGRALPVRRWNFALSFAAHAAAVLLVATSGLWMARKSELRPRSIALVADPANYVVAPGAHSGGGGGGTHDPLPASNGTPPRFADHQFTPPVVVLPNQQARLQVEPTVIGPPDVTFPAGAAGDPLSTLLTPSNGPGSRGGIGSGDGGGVGPGSGAGVGVGSGGGIGGGVYIVGGGVSAPHVVFSLMPEYSDEARRNKYQGTVVVDAIVGTDGLPYNVHVHRSVGMGLDEKAVEAVRKWRFQPGQLDGHPVAVAASIQVNFHLY